MSAFMPLQTHSHLDLILHASCKCRTLDDRDAVMDALRPLVEQGWQIDFTYSFVHQPAPRHVTLGMRVDVFDQPSEPVLKIA
jgi:hypothetical protein